MREARPFGPLRGRAADAARSLVAASRLAWSIEANWTQPLYLVVFLAVRPLAFLGLFLAFLLGSVIGILLIATGRRGRRDHVPFGPFLALGTVIALLLGEPLLALVGR